MLDETLAKLTATIRQAPALSEERRAELLQLLQTLEGEVSRLAETHDEHAASITRFTEVSAHEAVRQQRDPKLVELSLQGLSSSVSELENSHPQLVSLLNSLCNLLSNLGV